MDVRSTLASLTYAQARPATAPAPISRAAAGSAHFWAVLPIR